jgi:hypothetical protein
MRTKKLFIWIVIIAAAILGSSAIIFPSKAFAGLRKYQNHTEIAASPPAQPEEVVRAFYEWYLAYFGERGSESFRNPLADRAYADSVYLTASFVGHIDDVLAGFDGKGGFDPFLCAQDIPGQVTTDGTFYHNGQASVVLHTDFANHFLITDLQQVDGNWKIINITCGATPAGTAKAFYTWYLAYIGEPGSDSFRNPLVDRAYRDSGFLSDRFIQELDDLLAEEIPADPILMAQDIPQDFTVDPGTTEKTAVVHLMFGAETVRHLKISMIEDMGVFKIDGISLAQ